MKQTRTIVSVLSNKSIYSQNTSKQHVGEDKSVNNHLSKLKECHRPLKCHADIFLLMYCFVTCNFTEIL